jgi:hypothetical protein
MQKRYVYILAILLFVGNYALAQSHPYKPFSHLNTSKFGGYCFYNQLPSLFPASIIDTNSMGIKNLYEQNTFAEGYGLILISNFIVFSEKEVKAITEFVRKGNHVFISGAIYDNVFTQKLDLDIGNFDFYRLKDYTKIWVNKKTITPYVNDSTYVLKPSYINNAILVDSYDSHVQKLGSNSKGETNFVKVQYGSGYFYIHSAPYAFCNQFLLTNENHTYLETIVSHMPKTLTKIYFDEHQYYLNNNSSNSSGSGSSSGGGNSLPDNLDGSSAAKAPPGPLDYIWGDKNLKAAAILALAALALWAIFAAFRKQRPIVTVPKIQNNSKELVNSITDVYLNQHDNKVIADKKVKYFNEIVRSKYNIQETNLNSDFWDKLQAKTNMDDSLKQQLSKTIVQANANWEVSNGQLIELSNALEKFYKI